MIKFMQFLSILLLLSPLTGQDFSGYILYEYSYTDSLGEDLSGTLSENLQQEQHYYINGKDYVALDQDGMLQQLYNSSTNTYYFVVEGQIRTISADLAFPAEPTINKIKDQATILGYDCSAIQFVTEIGKTTYYYASALVVPPDVFTSHRFGNWAEYLNQTKGALPLRIVSDNGSYTTVMEAMELEEGELPDEIFDINTYIEK